MGILQRVLLTISVVGFLAAGSVLIFQEKETKLFRQWEQVKTEQFLQKICRTGVCTYEEYLLYLEALTRGGNDVKVTLEEYQKESSLATEKRYYYLISWEELQERMLMEGRYEFRSGSVVVIQVNQKSKSGSLDKRYCDTVAGRK